MILKNIFVAQDEDETSSDSVVNPDPSANADERDSHYVAYISIDIITGVTTIIIAVIDTAIVTSFSFYVLSIDFIN